LFALGPAYSCGIVSTEGLGRVILNGTTRSNLLNEETPCVRFCACLCLIATVTGVTVVSACFTPPADIHRMA
jgi:hypothetical protein